LLKISFQKKSKEACTVILFDIYSFVSVIPWSKSRSCKLATAKDKAIVASTSAPQFWDLSHPCTTFESCGWHGTG